MNDPEPQTAGGKVLWHFTMSLDGWDATPDDARPYSDAWEGSIFVLTHHPEDAMPADGVTFLDCDPAEAVGIGLKAAGGKNLEVLSPSIGRQLLELGLIRLFDNPGGGPVRLELLNGDATAEVNLRYRPTAARYAKEAP